VLNSKFYEDTSGNILNEICECVARVKASLQCSLDHFDAPSRQCRALHKQDRPLGPCIAWHGMAQHSSNAFGVSSWKRALLQPTFCQAVRAATQLWHLLASP